MSKIVEVDELERWLIRTLEGMEDLALKGSKDPLVLKNAMRIVRAYEPKIPRKAYLQEINALLEYAQGKHPTLGGLRFARDPHQLETLRTPPQTEEVGYADADELAVWLAAHMLALGHGPLKFVVVSTRERPDQFVHVYLLYGNPEGDRLRWIALDPTVDEPMGWEYPTPGRKAYYPIGGEES